MVAIIAKGKRHDVSAYSQYGSKCPNIIDQPIRKVLGKLGVLLEEYGYNVATKAGSYGDEVSVLNNKNFSPYPTNSVPYLSGQFGLVVGYESFNEKI